MRRVRRLRPDALVLDSIAAAFVGPWLSVKRAPAPLVGMLHQPPGGIDYGPVRSALQAQLDRLAYRRARLLMVASEQLRDQLEAQSVPGGKIRVVPPGRDVAPLLAATPPDLRHGRNAAILCVGNWVERKGILDLLETFSRLPEGLATLHLVGDDHADPRYAMRVGERLSRPDLVSRVVVHGALSRSEVAAMYTGADLFALPSVKEPYGTVYGEAMSAGLPVVGWRAGNLPYLAQQGREGLLVEPGDLVGLARALETLVTDEDLRVRMGEAARRRALSFPTWEESARLFFGYVRDALSIR